MRDLLPVFEAAAKGVAFVGGYLADALSERLKAFARYEDGDYLDASAASPMAAAETVDSVAGTPVDEGSSEVALSPRPSGERQLATQLRSESLLAFAEGHRHRWRVLADAADVLDPPK